MIVIFCFKVAYLYIFLINSSLLVSRDIAFTQTSISLEEVCFWHNAALRLSLLLI